MKNLFLLAALISLSGCAGFQIHAVATYDSTPSANTNPLTQSTVTPAPATTFQLY